MLLYISKEELEDTDESFSAYFSNPHIEFINKKWADAIKSVMDTDKAVYLHKPAANFAFIKPDDTNKDTTLMPIAINIAGEQAIAFNNSTHIPLKYVMELAFVNNAHGVNFYRNFDYPDCKISINDHLLSIEYVGEPPKIYNALPDDFEAILMDLIKKMKYERFKHDNLYTLTHNSKTKSMYEEDIHSHMLDNFYDFING